MDDTVKIDLYKNPWNRKSGDLNDSDDEIKHTRTAGGLEKYNSRRTRSTRMEDHLDEPATPSS